MKELGLGDKTRPTQKHIKAATILQMDGIRTGLHLSLCPGPHLAPCPLGGKAGRWPQARKHSYPGPAPASVVGLVHGPCPRQMGTEEDLSQVQAPQGWCHFQVSVGSLGILARVGTRAWLLQGRNLLSLQRVNVMKNSPQSPAGFNVVNFPSQLEKTKEKRREHHRTEM